MHQMGCLHVEQCQYTPVTFNLICLLINSIDVYIQGAAIRLSSQFPPSHHTMYAASMMHTQMCESLLRRLCHPCEFLHGCACGALHLICGKSKKLCTCNWHLPSITVSNSASKIEPKKRSNPATTALKLELTLRKAM